MKEILKNITSDRDMNLNMLITICISGILLIIIYGIISNVSAKNDIDRDNAKNRCNYHRNEVISKHDKIKELYRELEIQQSEIIRLEEFETKVLNRIMK
jgi:hypothetical protein